MALFRIILALTVREGESFIQFECDHPTIESLSEALDAGKLVAGKQLFTRRGKTKGTWYIVARRPLALDRRVVGAIQVPREDATFVEGEPPPEDRKGAKVEEAAAA